MIFFFFFCFFQLLFLALKMIKASPSTVSSLPVAHWRATYCHCLVNFVYQESCASEKKARVD